MRPTYLLRVALVGASALLLPVSAWAGPELIANGNFETTSLGTAAQIARATNGGTTVTGWTNTGYNFLFTPGSADTTGAKSYQSNQYLRLWGPNDGAPSSNKLTATSPVGGNFIGADGAYQTGGLSQQVSGLSVGSLYNLTFYWAAGQQYGFGGETTENWGVMFGNDSYRTATVVTPDHGFTPWRQESVFFTASAASQLLTFLAKGTPNGVPPFALLDGVSLVAAPEPATWAVMVIGLGAVAFLTSRRRSGRASA